jgi:hypothetical protein
MAKGSAIPYWQTSEAPTLSATTRQRLDLRWLDEDDDDPEPELADPLRPIKRLAAAIVLSAVEDLLAAKNRESWSAAHRFLFPQDPARREHLAWTLEVSAIGPWLRKRLASAVVTEPGPPARRQHSQLRWKT